MAVLWQLNLSSHVRADLGVSKLACDVTKIPESNFTFAVGFSGCGCRELYKCAVGGNFGTNERTNERMNESIDRPM